MHNIKIKFLNPMRKRLKATEVIFIIAQWDQRTLNRILFCGESDSLSFLYFTLFYRHVRCYFNEYKITYYYCYQYQIPIKLFMNFFL
jgi:hypothetical protein